MKSTSRALRAKDSAPGLDRDSSPMTRIIVGDCRQRLRELDDNSVHCVITSPPYFGLRDYGTGTWKGGDPDCDHLAPAAHGYEPHQASTLGPRFDGISAANYAHCTSVKRQHYRVLCRRCGARRIDRQIGLEATPIEFVAALVEVFGEIRRILRDDGTVWLNLGDRYATRPGKGTNVPQSKGGTPTYPDRAPHRSRPLPGIKPKDLIGIPWAVAFALRADGWYLRSDVIWAKPNPMPESVIDRPTSAHEHLFLLSKSPRYYYDADAIREPFADQRNGRDGGRRGRRPNVTLTTRVERPDGIDPSINGGRNKRNVWIVATQPFPEAHFATFPPRLVEPCVLGGSSQKACGRCGAPWQREAKRRRTFDGEVIENGGGWSGPDAPRRLNDGHGHYRWVTQVETLGWKPTCEHRDGTKRCVVLDPFAGSGTVGVVCASSGRDFIGIELNSEYAAMARRRIASQRDVVT